MKHTKRCGGTETRFTHMPVRDAFDACGCPRVARMETLRCKTCGTWLSLGPSDEAPVAVEVRAAELASESSDDASVREDIGWLVAARDMPFVPTSDEEHAGYLAHAIANHDEEQMTAVERLVETCARTYAEERGAAFLALSRTPFPVTVLATSDLENHDAEQRAGQALSDGETTEDMPR